MSELNPHIVKEHEGDFENTIQHFVTGRPLSEEEMLPDSHGVHPVSPLGFMMSPDGTTLAPAEPLSGFASYDVYRDCPACGGTGQAGGSECSECGGTGQTKYTAQEAYADSYRISGKYYMFGRGAISFPVIGIRREESNIYVTVKGLLPAGDDTPVYFSNLTTDDYTPTGLVGEGVTFVPDEVTPSEAAGTTELVIAATDIAFSGTVTEGKLAMCIATSKKFLTIEDPESDASSGIYVLGETEGEPIRKAFNWYAGGEVSPDGARPCREGNGYSDTEVQRWVSGKLGGVIRHGCHPSSEAGDLRSAGGLVAWFVACGDVDVSGGAGQNAVIVPGFGLGYGYTDGCSGQEKSGYRPDPDDSAERKWLTFGYGTKHDAFQADVGKKALPLDWPFTNQSNYADSARDNNITLVKEGVVYDDGTGGRVLGGLTRISRECSRCNGSGAVMEDGRSRPCPRCGGTGEEPDCQECGGTGEVVDPGTHETVTCPECHGLGFCGGHKYIMDKVHVCLFNDFTPSDSADGHTAGTTVLKKTFINLATPITQKDGDSFEITVSLPNVGLPGAYSEDMMKNLSGYYAYVSQPRAYVVSGTWEFSDTKVYFSTNDLTEFDLGGMMFEDRDGNELPDGTDVRVKILFDAYQRRKFSATGKISGGKVVLAEPLDVPAIVLRKIRKQAGAGGTIRGSICGAAYVESNNETLPSAIKTNLGLNAVRNDEGALGLDMGDGTQNSLQQYNKLYTADDAATDRKHVLFEEDGTPRKDQRQIVATVYPTVTNTFPWAITHRRKLGFLDKLMTMDADAGVNSIYARVYRMDRDILQSVPMAREIRDTEYPLDMYDPMGWTVAGTTMEKDRLSIIGALLTIVGNPGTVSTDVDAQPVRRAIEAAKILSDDFKNSRASRLGTVGSAAVSDYLSGAGVRADASELDSFENLGSTVNVSWGNDYEKMAKAVRLRHLPAVLATAGTDPLTGEPRSPVLDAYPYASPALSYYGHNPYGYGEFDTTARTEEVPCEVASADGTEVFGWNNSIVRLCAGRTVTGIAEISDLVRSAELHAVDFGDALAVDNVIRPHLYRDATGGDVSWMDAIDAFTRIVSPDNIPVPEVDAGYSSVYTAGVNDEQLPYIMTDAYGYYRMVLETKGIDWPGGEFIATEMPTDDSLARFLEEYVPAYAARLAVRHWDSYRVRVLDGIVSSSDTTYLTRMAWYDRECDDAASRGIYASDAFLVAETLSDMNMNRIEFGSAEEALALNCSVPPYTVPADFSKSAPFANEDYMHSVSYVRVFMRFVFSEDAGRWYCADYRQAPVSYLSPLYGARALDQQIDGEKLWVRPVCDTGDWRECLNHTYEEYRPLDVNPVLAQAVMKGKTLYTPSTNSYTYRPRRDMTNECLEGWTFEYEPGIHFYHVHVVLEWTTVFKFLPNRPGAACLFYGKSHDYTIGQWVQDNGNLVCNRINELYDITERIKTSNTGVLEIDADVWLPPTWSARYDMLKVGLRTDFSDGNGLLRIRDFVVTRGERRLMVPYLPASDGGLGLNAPVTKRGTNTIQDIRTMPHANFWNVREHLRPATGATPRGDIPAYNKEGGVWTWEDTGGIMSDAVLWGQYDYPTKDGVDYHIPDTDLPDADLRTRTLIYGRRNTMTGLIDTGDIQAGSDTGTVLAAVDGEPGE